MIIKDYINNIKTWLIDYSIVIIQPNNIDDVKNFCVVLKSPKLGYLQIKREYIMWHKNQLPSTEGPLWSAYVQER